MHHDTCDHVKHTKVLMNNNLSSQRSYSVLDIEIDPECRPNSVFTGTTCGAVRSAVNDIQLYRYEDIPNFLKGNPFIKGGYRAFLPASKCFSSLFVWNNESINIWSHLLGFVIFFMAMFTDNETISSNTIRSNHFTDHLFVTLGLLCYQACMLLSAGFHVFFCHSEKAYKRWFAMDLAGISIGLFGCYLPAVHLAFYCNQLWRDFYMFVVFCLALVTLCVQLHPRYLSESWSTYRMILYSCLAAYGIIPSIHWVYISGGLQAEVVQIFYRKIIVMYLLGVLALIFYITKFPERLFPGKVDYIGSSHQWWHVIVVIAFLYWHHSGDDILRYRVEVPCQY